MYLTPEVKTMFKKAFKKTTSILIAALLILSLAPTAVFSADDGAGDAPEDVIEIRTVDDLYNVRYDLAANYILMNDIDLSEATAPGGKYDYIGNGWNPIGSNDVYGAGAFSGVFDGNGHKITGMRIDINTMPAAANTNDISLYIGLFAGVTGEIKGLRVEGNIVISYGPAGIWYYVGAIAAENSGSILYSSNGVNITIYEIYYSRLAVGGMVGNNAGVIQQSYNNGSINATSFENTKLGGLVGWLKTGATVSDCYNDGDLSGKATYNNTNNYTLAVGGIAGHSERNTKVERCYNVGFVSSTTDSVYNVNAISCGSATVTKCYYLDGCGAANTGATMLTETYMKRQDSFFEFDFDNVWMIDPELKYPYRQLKNNIQETRIVDSVSMIPPSNTVVYYKGNLDLSGCVIRYDYLNAESDYITVTSDMISGFDPKKLGEQTVTVTYKGVAYSFVVTVMDYPFNEIRTVDDLYNVRYDLAANYILMNDIDLSEATAPGGKYDYIGNGWNPIGSNDVYGAEAFSGVFDGNGHKITGMRINVTKIPSAVDYNGAEISIGLFANVTGEIRSLKVAGEITTGNNGYKALYAGGIASRNTGAIKRSVNECDIAAYFEYGDVSVTRVGGVAGYNNGNIEECYNVGNIKSVKNGKTNCIGGISGESGAKSLIKNCYNAGPVSGTNTNVSGNNNCVGGIQGQGASGAVAESCYNAGTVSAVGGGFNASYAISYSYYSYVTTITKCYYLDGCGAANTGATMLTETYMKRQDSFFELDFDNVWMIDPELKYPYPQLKNNIQTLQQGVAGITLVSAPVKTLYYCGDEPNLAGGVIEVLYISGDSEELPITPDMIAGFNSAVAGDRTVTVAYEGFTVTFDITVKALELLGITIAAQPLKTEYIIGQQLDLAGLVVNASYNNGATVSVADYEVAEFEAAVGVNTVVVTFGGKSASFTVTFAPRRMTGISMESAPLKTHYNEGEQLDLAGMRICAQYNNGDAEAVGDYEVFGYDSTPGEKAIVVLYEGYTVGFTVSVREKALTDITVERPLKLRYYEGEAFDSDGLRVFAVYDNGQSVEVFDYSVGGFDSASAGAKVVRVSYKDYVKSFAVVIVEDNVVDLRLGGEYKTSYFVGDDLDLAGLTVTAVYESGREEAVGGYSVSGFDSLTSGERNVAVEYSGAVKAIKVSVFEVISGDVDRDGEITVGDALAALRIAVRLAEATPAVARICDADGDGAVTVGDALRILRVATGLAGA